MARLWAIALLTVGVVVACDRVPLTSPTGSTISLSTDRDTLPLNGQATVTAVVTEVSGTAVQNGTLVTFQASLGRTDPVEAETNNGKATVTFLAGSSSGVAVIQAFSGAARSGSGNSTAGGVSIKVGTAGTERVAVRSEPLSVPVSGGTVTVIGAIFDANGNPIGSTPISFSSDFGSLSANTAITDANGEARVQLTTNRTTKITVTAGAKTGDFTLNALVPPSVTLTNCGTNNAGNVGVPVSCTITPTVSGNGTSSAPIQNVTINWGDGTGEQPLGIVNGATVVSHTYSSAGSFQVVAAATDANSQRGQAIATLNITRSIPSIAITGPTNGTVGVPVTFTVTPPTVSATSIPTQNVTVNFGDGTSRDLGSISAATSVFKTYSSTGTFTVSATVTDTAGGRNTTSTVILIQQGAGPTVNLTLEGTGAVTTGSTRVFTVTATPGTAGTTITNVRVTLQDGTVMYSGSPGSFTWQFTSPGTATLTAVATDSVGNTATKILLVPVS